MNQPNIRALASQVLEQVLDKGSSLNTALPVALQKADTIQSKGRLQEMVYGSLRHLRQLQFFANELLEKPLKKRHRSIELLLYVGLYQLQFMRLAEHAVVSETVESAAQLQASAMKNLVNGVLRAFLRQKEQLNTKLQNFPQIRHSFPNWLYQKITTAYPEKASDILQQSNLYPPMWLRVNQQLNTTTGYKKLLQAENISATTHPEAKHALLLDKAADVAKLPGFEQGQVSVQDAAAQLSVDYLQAQANERVLDCCSAPGGKTCHILEATPDLGSLIALDADAQRLNRVTENLTRLNLDAKVVSGDAAHTEEWWDGKPFDRILLDAPCSATGVIRRHPDIKWLRKKTDIANLVVLQQQILRAVWQLLKPGGRLVYATCSILPDENSQQIKHFLAHASDAELINIDSEQSIGRQILPGEAGMDGFYYAVLVKSK